MNDSFAQKVADPQVAHDIRTVGDFVAIYCRGKHKDAARVPLTSDAAFLGVYGDKVPECCEECAELTRYAEARRAYCPKDPKPFCSHCDTHCYRPQMKEAMREVMEYSGPRSVFHGYALDSVRHAVAGMKARREMRGSSA